MDTATNSIPEGRCLCGALVEEGLAEADPAAAGGGDDFRVRPDRPVPVTVGATDGLMEPLMLPKRSGSFQPVIQYFV